MLKVISWLAIIYAFKSMVMIKPIGDTLRIRKLLRAREWILENFSTILLIVTFTLSNEYHLAVNAERLVISPE
jgi:hypothetical protein